MMKIEKEIAERIYNYENPKRIALSRKYPFFKKPIIFLRHLTRDIQNCLDFRIRCERKNDFFDCVVARHQSILRRRLGDSSPKLQEQKIINLKQAIQRLNGVIIQPNHVLSLWKIIGKPNYDNGYVDGMLLSNGKVIEGIGGGLCQLSNFLYWIFLHAPIKTVERYHHSMDVFPDSGRTLPFGGGATILYNFIDLKVKNISTCPLQLKIWLTDNHLKGQILSPRPIPDKFHVFEKNHFFIKRGKLYFRYNEIYKETKIDGRVEKIEKITTNFAPVLYGVTAEYLQKNNFKVLDFTNREIKISNKE
ncbi:MAG: VanW family protein [bacterium]|nr:VanW family protein [bacterium]